MARYGKESDYSAESIMSKAVRFFGPQGVGLEISLEDECGPVFAGGGGYVTVQVCTDEDGSEVELETWQWDLEVEEFLSRI